MLICHNSNQAGKMKVLGLEVKNSMGIRMDGNAFEPGRR